MNILSCKCGKSKYTYDFITSKCCDKYYFKYFQSDVEYWIYLVTIKNKTNGIYYNISNTKPFKNTFKIYKYIHINNYSLDELCLTINVEDENLKLYYLENILEKFIENLIFE